ncbi:PAS domain-containing protein [Palleronia marisminoris]|uniref:Sensor protein DivL n=1 Tax=Palleronia marisminoris TaxID=315423 RepID=A0A1Y5SZJ2_9RHOB|nr:PAS-domain containing protein [Palleronia marisminoris]SFH07143.1 PAS domain-containing protein [Palleronia marisminoris]SLN51702.1 Sensor protein DivL [Palleronia marisminoris]
MAAQTTLMLLGMAGAVTAALGALGLLSATRPRLLVRDVSDRTVFILDADRVIDATATARTMLEFLGGEEGEAWRRDRVIEWLTNSFPDLPAALASMDERAERMVIGRDGAGRLDLEQDGDRLRLTMREDGNDRILVDRVCQSAALDELETLRRAADGLVCPVWVEDAGGRLLWANRDYRARCERLHGRASWPLPALFPAEGFSGEDRQLLRLGDDWFDIRAAERGGNRVITAFPATDLAAAESNLRAFKGTVARTFAHLTVGLAIFDRGGRLAVFNPALGDLTTLPIDILISQPTLASFLDALRSRRMMPEPKNYASWRDRVAAVEGAAQEGTFSELWHLPGGRTFRVTGRPQPDGAYALLIEDVTSEVTLTRQFRARIDTGLAVLNALPEAVAVFDEGGALTLRNAAYDRLWGVDETPDLPGAVAAWRGRCLPDPSLEDLAQAIDARSGPVGPVADLPLRDGGRILVIAAPLPGSATLLRFVERAASGQALHPYQAELPRAQSA